MLRTSANTIIQQPSSLDASVVDYLVNNFDILHLGQEYLNSLNKAFLAFDNHDISQELYYRDYTDCCRLAIQILNSYKSPEKAEKKPVSNSFDISGIKSATDIVTIAEKYTRLIKSGRYYTGLCPLHNEHSPSFVIYPDTQSWYCFGACNTGGDVISLVMKAENVDFKGALTTLRGH
jgi:hypothetical protein